jgi:MurNAc alpha-1-phosphate uridylyltransferase
MKAMILAAGRGERMRPLTDDTPKPLLEVGGKPLIVHRIEALRAAGLRDLVVNLGHLGDRIRQALSDGRQFGVNIAYSQEPPDALETGGGILAALPLLGAEPFAVVNGDIWTDYPFARLPSAPRGLAHLVLVDNPIHHTVGDFALRSDRVLTAGAPKLTFSGISVLRRELFSGESNRRFPLAPLLNVAIAQGLVSGEHYRGRWQDIGTPGRLEQLDNELRVPAPGKKS